MPMSECSSSSFRTRISNVLQTANLVTKSTQLHKICYFIQPHSIWNYSDFEEKYRRKIEQKEVLFHNFQLFPLKILILLNLINILKKP